MTTPHQAIILAAGRGSRLEEETTDLPKPLLPIGPRSVDDPTVTSFLRRQAEVLRDCGVEQVGVVVGYRRERIIADLERWGAWLQVVVNPSTDIQTSGSLHSFQYAARSEFGVLDGSKNTLLLDGDIVYERGALERLLDAGDETCALVHSRCANDSEEVLVYGTPQRPLFLGKGLGPALVNDAPCIGEATGIIKIAPADHLLVREIMNWLLGDPDAPEDSAQHAGFGPARRGTEHEELSQRLMHLGKIRCIVIGEEFFFAEIDTPAEYEQLRASLYPRLLRAEAAEQGKRSDRRKVSS